jgi:PKD repeat protein
VRNPTHTYDAIGTYDVALTITTVLGDERVSKADFIRVAPSVDFQADKVTGPGALSVAFTDMTDPGALEIESWLWDFGDGGTSDEQHPRHDYTPGLFNVGLTVTTGQGEASTVKEAMILVTPEVTIGVVQPTGPAPYEASLLDLTQVGAFVVEGRLWEFGDGTSSEEKDPVHIYEAPGKYTVKLTLITNGGEFSKTIADYITAQRGPTAAFTHTVIRGGAPADPVTVSYVSMALPGDAPILNQEWDFGESAIATEEAATEANPTVTYPGTLFDTIPQDVSLTVRTVIAENVLVKENLFGAPVAKSVLPEALLDEAVLTAIATDVSGDVWAIGSADSPIVLRMNPEGGQRWGMLFEPESGLTLHGVHAPGDGTVYVAGEAGKTAWIARFDARGELMWEFRLGAASATSGVALSTRADGTVVLAVRSAVGAGEFGLHLMELDERGRVLAINPTLLPLGEGDGVRIAMGDDEVVAIVGSDSGMSVIWRLATGEDAWAIVYTVQGGPREISGVEGLYGIDCAVGEGDSSRIVRLGFSGAAETLLEVTSHLVAISARDARFEATWLYRLEDGGPWKVGREFIGK